MTDNPSATSPILSLYLQLAQYPILARQIRQRMREELFRRGVISPQHLEQEAKEKAVHSQHREGLADPYAEEDTGAWEERMRQMRDHLTDFYFAYNLPPELFQRVIEELVSQRVTSRGQTIAPVEKRLTFNPELAPVDLLLRQASQYESLPPDELAQVRHHLEEIIVVLTRTMVSDSLSFVRVAKAWFSASDFEYILSRRIGGGKIGGKAGGMLLAWKILTRAAPDLAARVTIPESFYLGADLFYGFKAYNGLAHNQKYKPLEQIRAEYPAILRTYEEGRFSVDIIERLQGLLSLVGRTPLIVRSSSLLEDNFGTSFAGKYASYFCPNQGSPEENLRDLTLAIRRIYSSVYGPDAIIYRRRMGLLDYDERMAILIQAVQGQPHGRYFFPNLSGVAFSESPIVWTPRLRREEGFVRLVMGLGTRAVERVGEDFPRLVFLSHPQLRPEKTPEAVEHYSQHWVDAIDLQANAFATVPAQKLLDADYPPLRWVASLKDPQSETLLPLSRIGPQFSPERTVLTFDNLLSRTDFAPLVKNILRQLADNYGQAVDVEFAMSLRPGAGRPELTFHLLQCRPQSTRAVGGPVRAIPADLPAEDKLFSTNRMVPQGQVEEIEYLVYVDPKLYYHLPTLTERQATASLVGLLNKALEGQQFILIGPGRWGSSNLQLGVPVTYADIFNARALVELSFGPEGDAPEPSYGTHFFQDLVEAQIYSLAITGAESGEQLNRAFLDHAGDVLPTLAPGAVSPGGCLRVIHIPAARLGCKLELVMDGAQALAYFARPAS